ncbi:MAG: hypothetical protein L6437_12125, partial [Kiritimatiellae bacterium]|nr:hypothetical protein [Kiritimatiellia bacterium]
MSINPNHKPMVSPMTVVPEQAQENNRRYWLWLVSLTIVCCGLIVAAGVSYYYRYHSRLHFTPEITISPNRQFFLDDPILGYRNNPGTYTITITNRQVGKSLAFKVVVDDQGYRTTSPSPKVYEGKPEIWLFGCSYTWGWELNNPETFPWLLQARLVDYKINNYAVAGYGNVHGYLQLKQALDQGRLAIMAVFVYNYFHLPRNVAAPSRLMEFQSVRDIGLLHHP